MDEKVEKFKMMLADYVDQLVRDIIEMGDVGFMQSNKHT